MEIYGKSAVRQARNTRFARARAVEMHLDMSEKAFCAEIYSENAGHFSRGQNLRSLNAHRHVRTGILCRNLQRKCRTLLPGPAFCASLRNRNAHGHVTRGMSRGNFKRKKMPYAYPATAILCAPAQSKCTWTGHKRHFVRKFMGKMPDATGTTSIEHHHLD